MEVSQRVADWLDSIGAYGIRLEAESLRAHVAYRDWINPNGCD
jgi:hypothetical protein